MVSGRFNQLKIAIVNYFPAKTLDLPKVSIDEKAFRWALNDDAMATEKLAEGIRNFAKDARTLEKLIEAKI